MENRLPTIEKIEVLSLALITIGAVVGWAKGFLDVPSFVLGALVMQLNFWLLKHTIRTAFSSHYVERGYFSSRMRLAVWILAKSCLYLVLLTALFVRYPIDAKSFAAGVPLLLVACVIVGLGSRGESPKGSDSP